MTIEEDIEKYAESFLIIISQEDINKNKKKDGFADYKKERKQLKYEYKTDTFSFIVIKKENEITVKEVKKEENKQLVTIYKMDKATDNLYINMIYSVCI